MVCACSGPDSNRSRRNHPGRMAETNQQKECTAVPPPPGRASPCRKLMSQKTKRTLSIVSSLVLVACFAIMIADFNLWWLPICALPFFFYGNWGFHGTWESQKVDEEAIKMDEEEPYSKTWPFDALEATPSKDYQKEAERLQGYSPAAPSEPRQGSEHKDFTA